VDNRPGDENPYLYIQENNYIAQVKLGSSIEIAQEATSFSNLVVYKSLLAIINAVHKA